MLLSNIYYLQEKWQRTGFAFRDDASKWKNTKKDIVNIHGVYDWSEVNDMVDDAHGKTAVTNKILNIF